MVAKATMPSLGLIAALIVSFSAIDFADARQNDKGDLGLADADALEIIKDMMDTSNTNPSLATTVIS